MTRTTTALFSILLTSRAAFAACPTFGFNNIGGHASSTAVAADLLSGGAVTYIDFTRPARVPTSVDHVDFAFVSEDGLPFTVAFEVVTVSGTTYRIAAKSDPFVFTPPAGTFPGVKTYAVNIPQLSFPGGSLLGVTVMSQSPISKLGSTTSDLPGSYAYVAADPAVGRTFDRDELSLGDGARAIAAEAINSTRIAAPIATCVAPPSVQLIVPMVGDTAGIGAHYATDVTIMTNFAGQPSSVFAVLSVRDRISGAVIPHAIQNLPTRGVTPVGDLGDALQTRPFIGSLALVVQSYTGAGEYDARYVTAVARITGTTACGETDVTIPAVSCSGIGRVVKIPINVPPNHRMNVGIASAPMTSCGIYAEATSVDIAVDNGAFVTAPMPNGSTQLNDVTGRFSAIAPNKTTGLITIRVRDDAARIAAYASVIDNQSEAATVTLATIER
jgi:hypothetical protein